jgi:predicted PurR-regulated permease PerM
VILCAVALTESTFACVMMAVIQIIYQQVENYIIYPIVYRRAVELSPFTTIVAVLIAGALLGVVGAILAVPFAAVIKTVLREAGAPRRERMAALRAAENGEPVSAGALVPPAEPESAVPASPGSSSSAP